MRFFRKKRIIYTLLFLLFLFIEVLIGLFVRDNFVRPYVGDMLVVVVIYFFIRIFLTDGFRALPAAVFVFAVITEVLQYFNIVRILGLDCDQRDYGVRVYLCDGNVELDGVILTR